MGFIQRWEGEWGNKNIENPEKTKTCPATMNRIKLDSAVMPAFPVMMMYTLNIYNQNCDLISNVGRMT